jgi:hypothetical protein
MRQDGRVSGLNSSMIETKAVSAASEGATLGLGPAVTLELLIGLLRDAERLGDETLAKAVAVYQEQLLLVLAQQAGPLSDIAGATTTLSSHGKPDNTPASVHRKPVTPTPDAEKSSAETVSEKLTEASGGRRRR